jgi:hypothetical protein
MVSLPGTVRGSIQYAHWSQHFMERLFKTWQVCPMTDWIMAISLITFPLTSSLIVQKERCDLGLIGREGRVWNSNLFVFSNKFMLLTWQVGHEFGGSLTRLVCLSKRSELIKTKFLTCQQLRTDRPIMRFLRTSSFIPPTFPSVLLADRCTKHLASSTEVTLLLKFENQSEARVLPYKNYFQHTKIFHGMSTQFKAKLHMDTLFFQVCHF